MGDAHFAENANIFLGNVVTVEDHSVEIIACHSTMTAPVLITITNVMCDIEFFRIETNGNL